jgi:hypothetical protein
MNFEGFRGGFAQASGFSLLTLLISIFNSITHIPLVEALQMMGLKI